MKKILAMLLISVMSLSMVACGGNKEEKPGLTPAEGQEAIEVTTENWETYFELEEVVRTIEKDKLDKDGEVVKDKDGKVVKVTVAYVDYKLSLKDEYAAKFEGAELVFTYKLGKQAVKTITYNLADGKYELADSKTEWKEDAKVSDDKLPTITLTNAETYLYLNEYCGEGVESGTYVGDTMTRPELQFTKVEGNFLIKK